MLFPLTRPKDTLQRALHAAIAAHRPLVLRHLFVTHGEAAFRAALASSSARVVADALSMLAADDRDASARRPPRDGRLGTAVARGVAASALDRGLRLLARIKAVR